MNVKAYKKKILSNNTVVFLFWAFFIVSILSIILVKFTPFKNLPQPTWFPYGNEAIEVLFNLAIGYIVSSLFYFILVYMPERIKKQSAMKIIQDRLNTIRLMMEESVNYLYLKMNTTKVFDGLTEHDFEAFIKITNNPMNLKCTRKIMKTGEWGIPSTTGEVSEIQHFFNERNVVCEKITQIFSIPAVINVDSELIEILSEIRDSLIYVVAPHFMSNPDIKVINFNKGVYKYYELFKKLRQYTDYAEYKYEIIKSTDPI